MKWSEAVEGTGIDTQVVVRALTELSLHALDVRNAIKEDTTLEHVVTEAALFEHHLMGFQSAMTVITLTQLVRGRDPFPSRSE